MSKPLTLNRTVAWFNKTEGRDKICKTLQYGSRFLMWYQLQHGNKELSTQFQALFKGMQTSRKLFRLAKTLNEIQKILEIISNKGIDEFDRTFQLLQRVAFALYWVFDNIAILSTIKFLNVEPKPFNKAGMTFWFLALVFGLVVAVRDLLVLRHKKGAILRILGSEQASESENTKLRDLQKKEFEVYLNLLKIFGDFIPASMGSEIFPKLTGRSFNDGQIGLGGLVSGVISAYQAY